MDREKNREYSRKYRSSHLERVREKDREYAKSHKEEKRAYSLKWRKNNKDKINEKYKDYYLLNRDKIKAQTKQYYELHKDQVLSSQKIRNKNNRERINAAKRAWRKNNPERMRESYNRRRAIELGKDGSCKIDIDDWIDLCDYFNYHCAYCLEPLNLEDKTSNKYITVDHMEALSACGIHDISNVVPCCRSCNSKKWKKSLLDIIREGNILP